MCFDVARGAIRRAQRIRQISITEYLVVGDRKARMLALRFAWDEVGTNYEGLAKLAVRVQDGISRSDIRRTILGSDGQRRGQRCRLAQRKSDLDRWQQNRGGPMA
jgi:hypothetical protein